MTSWCTAAGELRWVTYEPTLPRGGTKRSVIIKDEAELRSYAFDEYETVADFVETNLKIGQTLWHGHLCLAGDLLVEDVAHLQLKISSEVPTYWLRCRGACVRAGYIHLAELVLWFYLPGDMVPGWVIADEPAMDQRHQGLAAAFTAYNYEAQLHRHRSRRGGAPKTVGGRLQWESSRTIAGIKIITEFKAGEETLKQIPTEDLCQEAKGVVACLLKTWTTKVQWEPHGPLVLVLPGACSGSLRRMGAAASRITEHEIIVKDPDEIQEFKRRATILVMTDHSYQVGGNIQELTTSLEPSVELCVEFDERWSSQAVVGAVERKPRDGIRQALARLGKLVLEEGTLYSVRLVGEKPFRLWSAKLRQPTDAAERLICASGQDAFFLRPSSSSTLPAEDKFEIVWGAKHADCSPTLLAELLQRAQQVPGHRGLARSMIGIGLRSPWTAIKLARRSFAPNDQRFTDDNLELKDELHFVIEGCPPQSQVADVVALLKTMKWKAIPQQRRMVRGMADWWVSSASQPPGTHYRWNGHTVLIRVEDPIQQGPHEENQEGCGCVKEAQEGGRADLG